MCSVVSTTVSTFDDKLVSLANYTKPNCSVLLVADCSITSRFALFISPMETNSQTFQLELHVDDNIIYYSPRIDDKDFIRLANATEIEITSITQPFGHDVDLRYYNFFFIIIINEFLWKYCSMISFFYF